MQKLLLLAVSGMILTGCASNDALQKKTAFALGEDVSQVTVNNVDIGGYETTWVATTPTGKYNCSAVGGNPMSFGVVVSPSCVKVGSSSSQQVKETKGFCNAMLRAASKCK